MTMNSTPPATAAGGEPATDPRLRIAVEAPIGWLIVDHPERRNAVSLAMWKALPALVAALDAEPAVRVIVLAGGGEQAFVSGADIAEFAEVRRDAASARAYEDVNEAAFAALRMAAKPTVAMIRGPCFGGGVGLAAACDLRIAADDAVFSIPAAKLGIAYPPPAIADVVALVGASRAKDMFFTARRLDHAEALAIGLVDRVVPAADLRTETLALAETIAANAPLTIAAAKTAIAAAVSADPAAAARARAAAEACFSSTDFAEGRDAFLAKRTPRFEGR
ncbi:enoyl-CoA hydratase [Pseudoxanthobacter sp. M-2]|uniref:enoyl-CoA hydratase n=1 Tax=Pseudoxanthobacter sp. M-2 TaxID=3078754 RepID=UPI0038FCEF50